MSSVKIYTAVSEDLSPLIQGEGFCVDIVRYSDYAALEAKCAELAAENAALKAFGGKLGDMHNDLNGEGTGIQGRAEVACQQVALEAAMEEFDDIKTKATYACLAEVRAQARDEGINYAASRLAAAFNHGFVDKPLAEVYDVVHMIMTAKEDLVNDPLPADDGLSGEYAEEFLEDIAAQLRQDTNTAELVAAGIITKVGE